MPQSNSLTSEELAAVLDVSASSLRKKARAGRIPAHKDGSRYTFDEDEVRAALERRRRPKSPPQETPSRRAAYVLDLCDDVLGAQGSREHTFDWLLGDPNQHGRRARLRVDSYWQSERLIVEVHESQHQESTPFFDRRATLSGMGRADQRRLYDARRAEQIPLHGLRLVVVHFADLSIGAKGRRRPDPTADLATVRKLLEPSKD